MTTTKRPSICLVSCWATRKTIVETSSGVILPDWRACRSHEMKPVRSGAGTRPHRLLQGTVILRRAAKLCESHVCIVCRKAKQANRLKTELGEGRTRRMRDLGRKSRWGPLRLPCNGETAIQTQCSSADLPRLPTSRCHNYFVNNGDKSKPFYPLRY